MSLNTFKNLSNNISKSISNNLPKSMPMNTDQVVKGASNAISDVKNTLLQNIIIILVIFFVLLIFTIFVSVFNLSFKEKEFVKDKAYILEGMKTKEQNKKPKDTPVRPKPPTPPRELAKKHYIEKSCKYKNKTKLCSKNKDLKSCNDFSCCVWVNYKKGAKCEPGTATGPEIKKYNDDGELGYDHYYYKNKKY
jgi:hypothetical protein